MITENILGEMYHLPFGSDLLEHGLEDWMKAFDKGYGEVYPDTSNDDVKCFSRFLPLLSRLDCARRGYIPRNASYV